MSAASRRRDLGGRRILVTGAGSGIGLKFVEDALADGADCVATVRNGEEAAVIERLMPRSRVLQADLADVARASIVVADAVSLLEGPIDGLVYCAGVFDYRGVLETSLEQWRAVFDVNLDSAFEIARESARQMVDGGGGSIVLVSSQIGIVGHPRAAAYAASKAAVNGLVRALAVELAPAGIRANAVAPGPIATAMTEAARADPVRSRNLVSTIPLGRFGEAGEVSQAIRFLISDAASFITGQVLCVDGGVTAA